MSLYNFLRSWGSPFASIISVEELPQQFCKKIKNEKRKMINTEKRKRNQSKLLNSIPVSALDFPNSPRRYEYSSPIVSEKPLTKKFISKQRMQMTQDQPTSFSVVALSFAASSQRNIATAVEGITWTITSSSG